MWCTRSTSHAHVHSEYTVPMYNIHSPNYVFTVLVSTTMFCESTIVYDNIYA